MSQEDKPCSQHPNAPHGFDRNASHNAGRYVCECEGWEPVAVQEPVITEQSTEIKRLNGLVIHWQDSYSKLCEVINNKDNKIEQLELIIEDLRYQIDENTY